jgi:hypothetical protein
MHTYVKLKSGRILVLFSDNTEEETMHGYPYGSEFDVEYDTLVKWQYSDIAIMDSNINVLVNYKEA